MDSESNRSKVTYRLTDTILSAIAHYHSHLVKTHRDSDRSWRRAPSANDAAEELLAAGYGAMIDRGTIEPTLDKKFSANAVAVAAPSRHAKKLRQLNNARAPKTKTKRKAARKAVRR